MNNKELLICEMLIGDGCLGNKNLIIKHSAAQKEYLEWKKNILISNDIQCGITNHVNNGKNGRYSAYVFQTKSYDWIAELKKEIYIPKKTFSLEILKQFTPRGVAIWYFDDGGLSQKKRNGKIYCNELMLNTGLQKDENQLFIDYFKNYWDINFSQVKNHNCYRLRCGTKEARKFVTIIKDFIAPGMEYKVNVIQ